MIPREHPGQNRHILSNATFTACLFGAVCDDQCLSLSKNNAIPADFAVLLVKPASDNPTYIIQSTVKGVK
jgi:hypothetical protein